ncbi:hypothetical protein C8R47DRAFT_1210381 [Mycena vitilis]|nr:hypothetical protein C8R47DRAFT_1210381 [Mycena vitilis]
MTPLLSKTRLLFSNVTVLSTTAVRGLAEFLCPCLGHYVQSIHVVFPVTRTNQEVFFFALIDLFAVTGNVRKLVLSGKPRATYRACEFAPPSCFLPILEGMLNMPCFRCLVLKHWRFPDPEIIPLVKELAELQLVACRIGRRTDGLRELYPSTDTVAYQGVMRIGTLTVEDCPLGWDLLQGWIMKSTWTGHLVLADNGDFCEFPEWDLNREMLDHLPCVEIRIDLRGVMLNVAVNGRLRQYDILAEAACRYVALYLERVWWDQPRQAIQEWLAGLRIQPHQLYRVHMLVAHATSIDNWDTDDVVGACMRNRRLTVVGARVVWEGEDASCELLLKGKVPRVHFDR